jgi:hypothetical protein
MSSQHQSGCTVAAAYGWTKAGVAQPSWGHGWLGRLAFWLCFISAAGLAVAECADPDFQRIFDGKSLDGWKPTGSGYWSVEDGAITGRITREHPCAVNQYLVWDGQPLADFELELQSRMRGDGNINGGFQFRSRLLPDGDVCGYQVDNNLNTPWAVRLYDEYGRHTLAWRGEHVVIDAAGSRTVAPCADAAGAAWFRLDEWHEYHLTCIGSRITLRVDGRLAAVVEDGDPRRQDLQGILALQLHSGPPSVVQFKNIRLKALSEPEPERPVHPPALHGSRRDAVAWWPLDAAGHGLQPPLRHVPQWAKFEMNVRAGGAKARSNARVLVMDGTHLDAGADLHAGPAAASVYLRCRSPRGVWNSSLFGKRDGRDMLHFNLFSVNGSPASEPEIGFEIRTDRGAAAARFPVSQIDPTAWHDLLGVYDGQAVAIYCDGKRMAEKPWSGQLQRNTAPLLIGAEMDQGKIVRHFVGELEAAAIWSRALTDQEIAALDTNAQRP